MAKKIHTILLNITGVVNKKIQLNEKNTYDLRTANKKIKDDLKTFLEAKSILQEHELPAEVNYIIRGGSSTSGCPMHHSVSSKVAKKIFLKGAKKKRRVFPRYVSDKIRVLDVYTILNNNQI